MGEFNYDLSQTFPEIPWVVNQQVSNTSLPVFYVTAALFYFFFFQDVCRWQYRCCWKPVADTKVPACFFPKNWGYEVSDLEDTSTGEHCLNLVLGSQCLWSSQGRC